MTAMASASVFFHTGKIAVGDGYPMGVRRRCSSRMRRDLLWPIGWRQRGAEQVSTRSGIPLPGYSGAAMIWGARLTPYVAFVEIFVDVAKGIFSLSSPD